MTSADPADDFWQFSLDVYARADVADLCLALQDEHGFDVNVLLLCLWLGQTRAQTLDHSEIVDILQRAAGFNQNIVWPVRGARRWAKLWLQQASDPRAAAARDALYASLKAVELEAERHVQAELVECVSSVATSHHLPSQSAMLSSLEAYRQVINAPDRTSPLLAELALKALA